MEKVNIASKFGLFDEHWSPKIVAELNGVQGSPANVGGYYRPNPEAAERAMRPSPTFNAILEGALAAAK